MPTIVYSRRPAARLSWSVVALLLIAPGCNSTPALISPSETSTQRTVSPPPPTPPPPTLNTVLLPAPALPPVSPADPLVGRYSLEIDARERSGLRCDPLPEYATRRTYTADIHDLEDRYAVKLYDAEFLADGSNFGYGCLDPRLPQVGPAACHQFLLTGDAASLDVTMKPDDDWRGAEIWERLPDGFVLQIYGTAHGRVQNGQIEATGTGGLWYGNGLPATTSYGCASDDLRLTFTPR